MNKFMTRLLAVILILAMAITGCSAPAEPEETNNGHRRKRDRRSREYHGR